MNSQNSNLAGKKLRHIKPKKGDFVPDSYIFLSRNNVIGSENAAVTIFAVATHFRKFMF